MQDNSWAKIRALKNPRLRSSEPMPRRLWEVMHGKDGVGFVLQVGGVFHAFGANGAPNITEAARYPGKWRYRPSEDGVPNRALAAKCVIMYYNMLVEALSRK